MNSFVVCVCECKVNRDVGDGGGDDDDDEHTVIGTVAQALAPVAYCTTMS